MNRRLTLLAPAEADDGAGGVTRAHTPVTTLWAQVTPQGGTPGMEADLAGASLRYRVVIRHRPDVTTLHVLAEGTRLWRVLAAQESADRRFLIIDAETRQA